MSHGELHYASLVEVSRLIRERRLSSVEATEAQLARIAALDGRLHSYATVATELALAQARRADAELAAGLCRGRLHGVPIAVKDLCYTKDMPTACGTTIMAGWVPDEDATVVRRLRSAGAVILGKLQMTEGAFADHHPDVATPVNPWHADHWPGASSSGSGVATAAGLCYASLGSDTGGSIRFPSAMNGVTGLKPTWGRVSRHGAFPLSQTLDHIGPMTRTAADAAAIMDAIAGADPLDPTALRDPVPDYSAGLRGGIRGLVVGVDWRFVSEGVDPVAVAATRGAADALVEAGAELREIEFPSIADVLAGWAPLCSVETALIHEATYPSRASEYGPTLAGFIDAGRAVTGFELTKALLARHDFRGRLSAIFDQVDVVLIPAMYLAGPTNEAMARLSDPRELDLLLQFTAPFDMTGSPTITLQAGFNDAGVPAAVQLVGRHLGEDVLLRAGNAFQMVTDWHTRHPTLSP